jgi:hypothetical protein
VAEDIRVEEDNSIQFSVFKVEIRQVALRIQKSIFNQ